VIQLYNSTDDDGLDDSEVTVSTDGVRRNVPAGGLVVLEPGESITLPTRLYHSFWGAGSKVLVGEYQPVGRFPQVEEDEPPLHLLTTDYASWYRPGAGEIGA